MDTLRLLAVERLTHLASEVLQRESERFGGRFDVGLHFGLAFEERVRDAMDPREAAQLCFHLVRGGPQLDDITTREHDIEVIA